MKLLLNCFCAGPKLLMRFWLFDSALLFVFVHIHPFSSTETVPKTKSSLVEVFFLPLETANQSAAVCKQFQKQFRGSLQETSISSFAPR